MIETALRYLRAGLCVLPAVRAEKRPAVPRWKQFQHALPSEQELAAWCRRADALCLVCGAVSGNLEVLDFDLGGEAFDAWYAKVCEADATLPDRPVIERSPSGGWHVVYRCREPVCGNLKLAQRIELVVGPDEVTIAGKTYKPRQDAQGRWHVVLTMIETRGEGGLFLCSPTPGYELLRGDLAELPVLTAAERETLLEAAWSLNQYRPPVVEGAHSRHGGSDSRPGDDFNQRGDVREVLCRHGWTFVKANGDGNEHWRRPGKTAGTSATLKDGVFYCFTTSGAPFEPEQAYSPFAVYALLEHGGDYAAAASALRAQGFGGDGGVPQAVDLSGIADPELEQEGGPEDPGPVPDEMLRIPGFVSEVMDLCLATAPYPNQAMAFGGAIALQAFLAGRRVRDPGDNRTNIYLLGLAHSSVGKDWIRKLNAQVIHHIGLASCLGDRLASGEGIQEALNIHPAMLFQTDEIDGLLQSINKAKDARHESIMNTLLTLYSAANSIFPMRPKADRPNPGVIDQPHLVLFGTAIPNHYYEALSERMLTNGFFARMTILEAGRRSAGQEPGVLEVPERVLETAKWWADFRPGEGNLQNWHPIPVCVEATPEAEAALEEFRALADDRYAEAEDRDDPAGMAIWARAYEKARKLALVYAASENHLQMRIDEPAVQWAWRFVDYQTRRMLFMAGQHVAEGEFDARCKRMLEVLGNWRKRRGDDWMPHWYLSRRLGWSDRDIEEVRNTLLSQRRIAYEIGSTNEGGRIGQRYRLLH